VRVIEGRDVNELYWRGMQMLRAEGREDDSRVGRVLVFPEPVTSVYHRPTQRVLLDQRRAANPFFHLFESLWMLAGRDDVAALNHYITDFGTRFAEPNGRVHGAYGHRWRNALGFDQIEVIVRRLTENWRDRQCVLQMWDARKPTCPAGECDAPEMGSDDLRGNWKDRPCNTHVYFRVRNEPAGEETTRNYLDMLISCRSNDIVYGAYGANAVHFSVLHEYIAGRIDAAVGKMEQMSFNYHAYLDVLGRVEPVTSLETYEGHGIVSLPMGSAWDKWDADLKEFFLWHRHLLQRNENMPRQYANSWFYHTATPMFLAHWRWKNAMKNEAELLAKRIDAPDWRHACLQWFRTRTNARQR
jgi:thymidylate synthase